MTPEDVLRMSNTVEAECWNDGETAYVCRQCLRRALARAHAEGLEAGRREMAEKAARLFEEDAEKADAQADMAFRHGDSDSTVEYWRREARVCRSDAQRIRSLIPAAPEVIK